MLHFRTAVPQAIPLCFAFLASIVVSHLSAQESLTIAPAVEQSSRVTEGYSLFESGQPSAALEQFQLAIVEDGQDLSALLGKAMVYADLQRYDDAFQTYDLIVQSHPRHAFAWNGRGLAAFNMADFDEALNSFEKATAEQPVNGFFYESLAWTQMCRGEFTDAAASAKQATLMYTKTQESSIYPLLISYFAHLESGDRGNARRSLNYAAKNRDVNRWPSPVIDYLAGHIEIPELISIVTNTAQETEAHTYIGLKLRNSDNSEQGSKHLDWVARQGDPRVFEYTLARALNLQDSVALLVP